MVPIEQMKRDEEIVDESHLRESRFTVSSDKEKNIQPEQCSKAEWLHNNAWKLIKKTCTYHCS
jgi:hypothetical protein